MNSRRTVQYIVAVAILASGPALARGTASSTARPLTDAQLDRVAGAMFMTVVADGSAEGMLTLSQAAANSSAQSGTQNVGVATGQVTAVAVSTADSTARASSTLSLTLLVP